MTKRVNLSLPDVEAARLSRLAERARVSDGTLARSLLLGAIEDADPDAQSITEILEGVPGFAETLAASEAQVESGDFTELDDLS